MSKQLGKEGENRNTLLWRGWAVVIYNKTTGKENLMVMGGAGAIRYTFIDDADDDGPYLVISHTTSGEY